MADLNERARMALRRAVLEERSGLRKAYDEIQRLQHDLESTQALLRRHRDAIVDLQEAAGDPVEIDPSLPQIT